ncbi:MAG: isocitrate lyase/PEP mutase family protein [Rudaea sp.]
MNLATQQRKAQAFRAMHDRSRILLLPNAWDAVSARLFAQAGFTAIATTSGGVAWSLGYADGEHAPREEIIAATARIARSVELPVSADIEAGFGARPAAVADTVRAIVDAGAVGINLEDSAPGSHHLRDPEDAAARIDAARKAASATGVDIVINARIDTYLQGQGDDDTARLQDTLRRARVYLAAGADCVYPIGLSDAPTIAAIVKAVNAPINVGARPGMPSLDELARLGVARVSTATRFAALAWSAVADAASALRASGKFNCLQASLTHPDLQRLFNPD